MADRDRQTWWDIPLTIAIAIGVVLLLQGMVLAVVLRGGQDLLPAEILDDPLEAGPQLVLAVAVLLEDAEDRLDGGQQLIAGRELLEGQRRVRVGPEAAGDQRLAMNTPLAGAVMTASLDAEH